MLPGCTELRTGTGGGCGPEPVGGASSQLRLHPLCTLPFPRSSSMWERVLQAPSNRESRPDRGGTLETWSAGTHAHQVVPTSDGQGEWGVATPQHGGVCLVRQKKPDYVPGTLRGERQGMAG